MFVITMLYVFGGAASASDEPVWPKASPENQVYEALLPRDLVLNCASLTQHLEAPAQTLNTIVEKAQMPPWVPMRAATCMLDHHLADSTEFIHQWLATPEYVGLAKMVHRRLDRMPTDIATSLTNVAIAGPHQQIFRTNTP